MKLTFIGTRANIKHRTPQHSFNASCLVSHRSTTIMIDCGIDWLDRFNQITPPPSSILISHAHDDHIGGLMHGVPVTVYATQKIFDVISHYPIEQKHFIKPRTPFIIGHFTIEAFSVEHALNTQAVGYRISAGSKTIFYVPDLVFIRHRTAALHDIDLYIGDGARVSVPLIRKKDHRQLGHTTIIKQLKWCKKSHVPKALFTHCGTEIVTSDQETIHKRIDDLGKKVKIKAGIVQDNMVIIV